MGTTTSLDQLSDTLRTFDEDYVALSVDPDPSTETALFDAILSAAFTVRGYISLKSDQAPLPDTVAAAAENYDAASWKCTPHDAYGGDVHLALVDAAMTFLDSVADMCRVESETGARAAQ